MSISEVIPVEDLIAVDGDADDFIFVSERGEQGEPGAPGEVGGVDEGELVAIVEPLIDAAVLVETERATDAEEGLSTALTILTGALDTEFDRATAAEAALASDIEDEATARATADAALQPTAQKNQPNGYPGLDGDSLLSLAQVPAAIARDSEVTAAIAAEATARDAAITAQINALVGGAPAELNQLVELAAALGNDPDAVTDLIAAVATKQAAHANLTALAGLVLAANKLPYATGAGALGLTDFTAFARTLLDDGDAPTMRTTLGLGSAALAASGDFDAAGAAAAAQAASQPLSALLGALVALGAAANTLPYFDAAGLWAAATITAAGRALLDDATAADQRTTLGLGTAATHDHGDYEAAGALTTALAADLAYPAINTQADTYALVLGDAGVFVRMNKATALTLQVPTDAAQAFPLRTRIDFQQIGAGQLTIAAVTPGTTAITSTGAVSTAPKTRQQYAGGSLIKVAADSWTVIGDVV